MVERNAIGDVSALYTTGGVLVGTYNYDPYGRLLEAKTAEGYNDEHDILIKNPFRYRGYYYDSETGWYYLNSRYYDPNTKRFINADNQSYLGAGDEINSYNLFAYCGGDPVYQRDESGHFDTGGVVVGTGIAAAGAGALAIAATVATATCVASCCRCCFTCYRWGYGSNCGC